MRAPNTGLCHCSCVAEILRFTFYIILWMKGSVDRDRTCQKAIQSSNTSTQSTLPQCCWNPMGESIACGLAVCTSPQTTSDYRAPKHCLETLRSFWVIFIWISLKMMWIALNELSSVIIFPMSKRPFGGYTQFSDAQK